MEIKIRTITDLKDIYKILDLMREVWHLSDLEIVASFEMKAVSKFGILLGAYDLKIDESKPVGFIYGFPKFPSAHYSHQMGVDKRYQNLNVGFLLKKAHREIALESTNPRITQIDWTVDPLLGPNAMLNFRKLGVVCNTYYPNLYGNPEGSVDLYPSVPTDRILVEWKISSARVNNRFDTDNIKIPSWETVDDLFNEIPPLEKLNNISDILGIPQFQNYDKFIEKSKAKMSLEVPGNYIKSSKSNPDWAMEWRLKFREICLTLFDEGFHLVDFFSFKQENGKRRNVYIFVRDLNEYQY